MFDDFAFAPEPDAQRVLALPWKILIVDDEEEVHEITRIALADLVFKEPQVGKMCKFRIITINHKGGRICPHLGAVI